MFDLMFEILRKRPVRQVKKPTEQIEPVIDFEQQDIGRIAKIGQPSGVLNNVVKKVTMHDPETFAFRVDMNCVFTNLYLTEGQAGKFPRRFIMVARDIIHLGAMSCLSQDFLNDIVMRLGPVPSFLQLPTVDDIADKIECFATGVFKKVQELHRPGATCAKMSIRYPYGSEM